MADVLEVEVTDRLMVLRLNRPDRKNALNGELMAAIARTIREAAADDGIWAIALTGNGDAFCSGLDLADRPDGTARHQDRAPVSDASDDDPAVGFPYVMRVECDKPIVAGINGVAVGIGVSLAMCADIRIAAPTARFHPGYARVGTSPDGGLSWTLPQAVGYERAMRFLLEQRMIDAAEALAIGLVGEVTVDGEFDERFLDYSKRMAEVAPIAARQTKQLLRRFGMPPDLAGHLRDEVRLALQGLASEDGREAVRAMVARERPSFRGR